MKFILAISGLMVCAMAQADLDTSSQNLSVCAIGYAQSQIKTSRQADSIAKEALEKCSTELKEVHDSIGPGKTQWENLSDPQKQAIAKIRDQTTSQISEQISSQIVTFVTESRKNP